jgi:phage gp46-like protein
MGQNWKFDPVKRDYVLLNGAPVPTDEIEEVTYFVLMIPRGQWLYGAAGQGSELYQFQNAKRLPNTEQLFAARVNEAVQNQIIAAGKAQAVAVSNLASSRSGASNQISITPLSTQISTQLNFTPL